MMGDSRNRYLLSKSYKLGKMLPNKPLLTFSTQSEAHVSNPSKTSMSWKGGNPRVGVRHTYDTRMIRLAPHCTGKHSLPAVRTSRVWSFEMRLG
jgi:hypothetical protein